MTAWRWLAIPAALLLATPLAIAQKASNWRVYKAGDGLPESACSAVYFSPQGKLLARHATLPFLSELDGFRINLYPAPQASKGRIYQSPGGQLWSASPTGLEEFRGNVWVQHPVRDMAASLQVSIVDPVPLYPVRQDLVLVLLPEELLEFNSQNSGEARVRVLRRAQDTGLERFLGMTRARSSGLWITGARGLARVPGPLRNLTPETQWLEYLLPDSLQLQNLQQPVELGPASESQSEPQVTVTALAESRTNNTKCLLSFEAGQWSMGRPEDTKLRRAWQGPDKTCWSMGSEGLWQSPDQQTDFTECEEVSARKYYDMASEPSGAFWLATSEGLFRFAPLLWQSDRSLRKMSAPVRCVIADQEKRLCFISGNRFYALEGETLKDYPLPLIKDRPPQARVLFLTKTGTVLLAAEDPDSLTYDLLFRFQPARGAFAPVPNSAGKIKALGMLKDGVLCVQRSLSDAPSSGCSLETFDGRNFEPFADKLPAALGNRCITVFPAQNGDLWISSETGTACLHEGQWRPYVSADKSNPEGASCFVELPDGRIWCAVEDQVWEFDGRRWSVLRRGLERINDMLRSRDGSIWIASNNGLLRYLREAWVENGLDDGLPATTVRDLFENERGLWAATARGLSLFHPEADPETDPPQTFIQKLSEWGNAGPEGGTVTITYNGRDKWKYTARERLLYSYRVDDREWTPFQEGTRITLTDLSPGNHYFQVRSMDRNCNVDPHPQQLDFAIVLPWYKETRLLLIACAGGAVALFFAAVAFNRHRQLVRSYAAVEAKVAERTHQLEVTSQELFHSQKMNALGTLAAGIAHDFNNILSIVKGSAQLIEDNLDKPDKIQVRTERIKTVVEQGAGIVKAMLGFSRDSGPLDPACDVNGIVKETLKLLGDRFLREVEVAFEPAEELPTVPGSKDIIQQILLNFIFNAAESMADSKIVRLETKVIAHTPAELVLPPAAAPRYVVISVQDSGCGISKENLTRIFEPFFTTKALSARRGTGLGLSMAYELAKKIGAGLSVESVLDVGSSFSLILPVPNGTPQAPP